MDKKKVIELIKKGMLYQSKSSHVSSYKEKAKNCFEEALGELQKSDWISVEDELPPYGEVVWCLNSKYPTDVWESYRIKEKDNDEFTTDNGDFIRDYQGGHGMTYYNDIVTHWRKIDNLEV